MRRLLLALLATYGVFFAVGYTLAERTEQIKIGVRQDERRPTEYYVIVTLPAVTPEYRWLEVFMCAASMDDQMTVTCDPAGWASLSGKSPRVDQRQYEIAFRYAPRGTKLILAKAVDQQWKVLASGRKVVLR